MIVKKKSRIDNGVAFLELYPSSEKLHIEDMALREKLRILKKNPCFDHYVSLQSKREGELAINLVKYKKTRLVHGAITITSYESAIVRLRRAIFIIRGEIGKTFNEDQLNEIERLEISLLNLPLKLLEKLLLKVIQESGLTLENY